MPEDVVDRVKHATDRTEVLRYENVFEAHWFACAQMRQTTTCEMVVRHLSKPAADGRCRLQ